EYEAGASPAAYAAGMTPVRIAASSESQGNLDAANRRQADLELAKNAAKGVKFNTAEQALLDSSNTVEQLGPQLLRMPEGANHGIELDPSKFGSWTDTAVGKGGGIVYRLGKLGSVNRDQINQLTGFLEVQIPRMLATGRLNQQQYDDLKMHAPQVGYSDG